MADELDQRLEARLRAALHTEADVLPLLVGAHDIELARQRNRRRRYALPASLFGMAAVVAILVIVAGAWRLSLSIVATSPATSAGPSQRELASYVDLEAMLRETAPSMPVVASGEQPASGEAATGTVTVEIASIGPYDYLNFAFDCTGGEYRIAVLDGDAEMFSGSGACGTHPLVWTDGVGSNAETNRITVAADTSVAWRLVATGSGPSISPLPTIAPTGLVSYDELAAYASSTIELLRNEGAGSSPPGPVAFGEVAGRFNLEFVLDCTGNGEVRVSVSGGGATSDVGTYGCGGPGTILWTTLDPALIAASHASVVVDAPVGTAWRLLVYDHSSGLRKYPAAPDIGFESTVLGTMSGTFGAGETAPAEAPVVALGATLVVAFGCDGEGLIRLVVDGIARDAACLGSNVMEFVPAGTGPSHLEITPDHVVRIDLELRSYTREQLGGSYVAPSATLRDANGSSSAPGFTSCLTSFAIPGGASADESCGPNWLQVPEARAVRTSGGTLELALPTGWELTGATAAYVDHQSLDGGVAATPATNLADVRPGVEGSIAMPTPPAGDWAVRVDLSGRAGDGTTFSAQQLYRVIVAP